MSEFVGREAELAFLEQVATRRRPGPAQLVLLYGRRRVGKTSLLRHWAAASGLPTLFWTVEKDPAHLPPPRLRAGGGRGRPPRRLRDRRRRARLPRLARPGPRAAWQPPSGRPRPREHVPGRADLPPAGRGARAAGAPGDPQGDRGR